VDNGELINRRCSPATTTTSSASAVATSGKNNPTPSNTGSMTSPTAYARLIDHRADIFVCQHCDDAHPTTPTVPDRARPDSHFLRYVIDCVFTCRVRVLRSGLPERRYRPAEGSEWQDDWPPPTITVVPHEVTGRPVPGRCRRPTMPVRGPPSPERGYMSAGHPHHWIRSSVTVEAPEPDPDGGPAGDPQPVHPPTTMTTRTGLTVVLWLMVTLIAGSAVGGVWALWPRQSAATIGRLPTDAVHADPFEAVVLAVSQGCPGAGAPAAPAPRTRTRTPVAATHPATGTTEQDRQADLALQQALQLAAAAGGDDISAPADTTATPGTSRSRPAEQVPTGSTPAGDSGASVPGGNITVGGAAAGGVIAGAGSPSTTMLGGDDAAVVTDSSCLMIRARLLAGPDKGTMHDVPVPHQVLSGGLTVGQRVSLARLAARPGAAVTYEWGDYSRQQPLTVLAIVFLAVVLLVARWRGITALLGLGLGYLTIAEFMLPALRAGRDPLQVALCGSVTIIVVILYVAHGVTAKTTTALLGTVSGLAVAAGLAWWASAAAHLNGLSNEDNLSLSTLPGAGLRGVILCGLVLASLGVLNDVTVTQASAVWEIAAHAPDLGMKRLFASGMRIGRDHLASTVYTIAFAYAGTALPTLMLVEMFSTPWQQVLTGGQIAEEVVRTLVGAIGLVLAIPLTTLIAVITVAAGTRRLPTTASGHPDLPQPGRPPSQSGRSGQVNSVDVQAEATAGVDMRPEQETGPTSGLDREAVCPGPFA
jgi:uncharacterized membrane protein